MVGPNKSTIFLKLFYLMQGINKHTHVRLMYALVKLEEMLRHTEDQQRGLATKEYLLVLEKMYQNYEKLLNKLAIQIAEYEELFGYVKTHHLGKKLKEIKRGMLINHATGVQLEANMEMP